MGNTISKSCDPAVATIGVRPVSTPVEEEWLSTGRVAKLCSVKPDTVQKWIRSGKVAAQRTAGGHYRLSRQDVATFLTAPRPARWFRPPPVECQPRPLRCWEYMSNNGTLRKECGNCVVYRVRASWCFEVLGVSQGTGHARSFCRSQDSCESCVYYRHVMGLSQGVLVVSAEDDILTALAGRIEGGVLFRLARTGYEASTLMGTFRPSFVVLDTAMAAGHETGLLTSLLNDSRVPGLKVILYGNSTGLDRGLAAGNRILGVLEKPFDPRRVASLIRRIPIERRQAGSEGNSPDDACCACSMSR